MRSPLMIPGRHFHDDQVRALHQHRVDTIAPYLAQGDPLADAVVEALRTLPAGQGHRALLTALDQGIDALDDPPEELAALFQQLETIPPWVDWDELELGGATLMRVGWFGFLVAIYYSLPIAYSSPAGNKPLVFSGRLTERATRRLGETGTFVLETCRRDGLRHFSEGFKITVKVRLMHAQMRRLLQRSGRWQAEEWGVPINQLDMAGTNILFSGVTLEGLRRFGFRFSQEESEAVMRLWRYSGYLLGIDPALLCATETEARRLIGVITATQRPPDEDAQRLTQALFEVRLAGWLGRLQGSGVLEGISRSLLGEERAEALGVPRTRWSAAVPGSRVLVWPAEAVRRLVPGARRLTAVAGEKIWEDAIAMALGGGPAE